MFGTVGDLHMTMDREIQYRDLLDIGAASASRCVGTFAVLDAFNTLRVKPRDDAGTTDVDTIQGVHISVVGERSFHRIVNADSRRT